VGVPRLGVVAPDNYLFGIRSKGIWYSSGTQPLQTLRLPRMAPPAKAAFLFC